MHNHKNRNIIIGGILLLAVISAVVIYIFSRHTETYATTVVSRKALTSIVRATGSIVPDQRSSLSFSSSGKIQDVKVHAGDVVHKGDILASLNTGTIQAQLDAALADKAAAEATLSKVEQGARPEEVALYSQKYADATRSLIVAMNNAYLQTSDAITNKSDSLFTNGNSVNPVINIRTQSQMELQNINQERLNLNAEFLQWKTVISNVSTSTLENARSITKDGLANAQLFLSDLSTITNNLSVGNSGLSQTAINADMAVVNGASQEATGAANAFTTVDAAWSAARDSLTLENAGSRTEDVAATNAQYAKAIAGVEGYQSALQQSFIVAPFDGTITEVNMKIGEVVVPGFSAGENIAIINTSTFNIEAYVPENSIGSMNAGNPASVTMDAYGSGVTFPAHVFFVSPAETAINGINSYKVTLRFDSADDRVRSGLTVNTLITTATSSNSLAIPTRSIITNSSNKYVLKKGADGSFNQQSITTGITSADGNTEILSGLSEGDIIANF